MSHKRHDNRDSSSRRSYPPPDSGLQSRPSSSSRTLNCPPGLEHLNQLDKLFINQKIRLLEVITGFETNNEFTIMNPSGQQIYYAFEKTSCWVRNCCGPIRPFDMQIVDNSQNEIIHLYRPLACTSCCFPCCLQSIEVSSPPGTIIGTVHQKWRIFCPTLAIKNRQGKTVLKVEGPCIKQILCCGACNKTVDYYITLPDGTHIGKISKEWTHWVRETFTDSDYFVISFPMNLDVRLKAVIIGACILLNAMYYERQRSSNERHM